MTPSRPSRGLTRTRKGLMAKAPPQSEKPLSTAVHWLGLLWILGRASLAIGQWPVSGIRLRGGLRPTLPPSPPRTYGTH